MRNSRNRKTQGTGAGWVSRRLVRSVLVILLVSTAVFFLIRLVPGDPAVMVLGEHANEEALAALRIKLGLNAPVPQQFARYLLTLFSTGDTGESIKYGVSCRQLVLQYAPVTLALAGLSLLITTVCTLLLSITAARHKNSIFDQIIRILPGLTHGMPAFWLGIMLILLFSVRLGLFPVGGLESGLFGMLHSLFLPAVTISFGQIPPLVRSLRERLVEVYEAPFVLTLRTAGLSERTVLVHVLKNAAAPTLMLLSVNLSYLIGGSLVIEKVFSIRGLGKLLFEAISNRDFPLVQAITLYCAFFVVLISLAADLFAHYLQPDRDKEAA